MMRGVRWLLPLLGLLVVLPGNLRLQNSWAAGAAAPSSLGVASCASSLCHGAAQPWTASSVLQTEYLTWSRQDKHARAYQVLLEPRSDDIMRRLGLKERARDAALCLDCHAHHPPADRRAPGFQLSDGVGCEGCHGPASGWIRSHVEPAASHARNRAHGLWDTVDDAARARLCLSCHLGTAQKLVTHQMMAAGHPRMSFELDTFTQLGPPHYRIDADWRRRKGSWDEARAWAVGQTVAAQQLLELLRGPRGRTGLFPELVLFDCHSCHHPMRDRRETALRVGAGPGVVRLNDANFLMLRQIALVVQPGHAATLAQEVSRLHAQLAAGQDPLRQAGVVAEQLDGLLAAVQKHPFTSEDLMQVLRGLVRDGLASEYADYQGAEQAVMAMQSVADFLVRRQRLVARPVGDALRRLLTLLARDEQYDPRVFRTELAGLARLLEEAAP